MKEIAPLLEALCKLQKLSDSWSEDNSLLSAKGQFSAVAGQYFLECCKIFEANSLPIPNIRFDGEAFSRESLEEIAELESFDQPGTWKLSLNKERIIGLLPATDACDILFISPEAFTAWASSLTPTQLGGCDFNKPVRIFVKGIKTIFGGPNITVSCTEIEPPEDQKPVNSMPDEKSVRKVLHVISDQRILLNPQATALTWGDIKNPLAAPFRRLSALTLALSISQDVYMQDGQIRVVIRGARRVDTTLSSPQDDEISDIELEHLSNAVEWVYAEREETRHKLLSDRISLDIKDDQSFVAGLKNHIVNALKQAKERYGFVILDRKDTYHKELRDIMKDVRTQADLFAAKVRDLINNLLRDTLAVLFLIVISLMGRVNFSEIEKISKTFEIQAFFKILSIYFITSATLQIISSWKDLSLSSKESSSWQDLTREYVTHETFEEHYETPLEKRKRTFFIAMFACGAIYILLALSSWHMPRIVEALIGNHSSESLSPVLNRANAAEIQNKHNPAEEKLVTCKIPRICTKSTQ